LSISAWIALWCLGAPWFLGLGILRGLGLRLRDDPACSLGWAWVLGSIFLGMGLFAYQVLGIGPGSWWTVPLVLGGVLSLAMRGSMHRQSSWPADSRLDLPYSVWILILALVTLLGIVAAGAVPVMETDEATIWATKAKLFFMSNGFDQAFAESVRSVPHADYPILNPLLQAWMFSQAGEILHFSGRLPIMCYAIALLLIAAGALRRLLSPLYAGALLLVLVDGEVFRTYTQRAHADIMVACGCLMAFDGWLRWRVHRRSAYAAIGCAGMALALWSKHEAALYLAAGVCAVLAGRLLRGHQARWSWTPWFLLPAALCLAQFLLNHHYGLRNDLLGENPRQASMFALIFAQFTERAGPVLSYAWHNAALQPPTVHSIYLLLALGLLLIPRRLLCEDLCLPTLTILLSLLGIFVVYIGSYSDLAWHLRTSAGRVTFQMVPFAVLWLALVINRLGSKPPERGS